MPFWLGLGGLLLGLFQQHQQAQMFNRALEASRQGLSPEEMDDLQRRALGAGRQDLARRGLLSSGLLPGLHATVGRELALAQAQARRPGQESYVNALLGRANQPSLIGSLVPLWLQYGLRGPGGQWLINPFQPQTQPVTVSP